MLKIQIQLDKTFRIVEIVRKQNFDYWDKDKRKTAFENLNKDLSDFFGVEKPKICFLEKDKRAVVLGMCDKNSKIIFLSNYSLITFLHEFFHYVFDNSETDIRIFSVLVFSLAYPQNLKKLILNNGCVLKRQSNVKH